MIGAMSAKLTGPAGAGGAAAFCEATVSIAGAGATALALREVAVPTSDAGGTAPALCEAEAIVPSDIAANAHTSGLTSGRWLVAPPRQLR